MKNTLIIIIFSLFYSLNTIAQEFDKKLNVYRNGIAVLELSTKVESKNKVLNIELPDSVIQQSIEVLSREQSNLKNVRVVVVEEEVRSVITNKQEFLLANIGKRAELEVVEGSETINYEGEILPLEAESKVLLLKTEGFLRMIPIEKVAHVSIEGEAKMSGQSTIKHFKLVVEFEKPNTVNHLLIRIPISGIGWNPTYNINLEQGKLSSLATITNNSLTESEIKVALMDAPYLGSENDLYSGESVMEWEKQTLFKDEILQKPLMEELVGTSLRHGCILKSMRIGAEDSLFREEVKAETRLHLPVFNNTKQIWPAGSLQIVEGNKSRFSHFPLLFPDKGVELDLGSSQLEIIQEYYISKVDYKYPDPNEEVKRKQQKSEPEVVGYQIEMKMHFDNPYPKPVFYVLKCNVDPKSSDVVLMKARQGGSPLMLINSEIEIKGNISAIKTSNFSYQLDYQ